MALIGHPYQGLGTREARPVAGAGLPAPLNLCLSTGPTAPGIGPSPVAYVPREAFSLQRPHLTAPAPLLVVERLSFAVTEQVRRMGDFTAVTSTLLL
ncbi:hypothetical protein GCM10018775_92720 [Streptomyces umbrinus]|nr:hypothetical protein GCM10018775_92720 [Streptomyces umbrinus]